MRPALFVLVALFFWLATFNNSIFISIRCFCLQEWGDVLWLFSFQSKRRLMSEAYAHTGTRNDKRDWERLQAHSQMVADRAASFAEAFDSADEARLVSLCHDLGKVTPEWQEYLEQKFRGEFPAVVPHSAHGSKYLQSINERWCDLFGVVIAGHHGGMPNTQTSSAGTPSVSLRDRLAGTTAIKAPGWLDLADLQVRLTPVARDGLHPKLREFALQFYTRMLFSSLVDGDYLATEEFYSDLYDRPVSRGSTGSLSDLRDNLDSYLSGFSGDSDLNKLRAEVLQSLRNKATQPTGLFQGTFATGLGKTLSLGLAFALDHAIHNNLRQIVIVAPYMSIVEQTADVIRSAVGQQDAVLEHHFSFDVESLDEDQYASWRLASENWDCHIVVTTAVQFFESLFSNKPSKCRKLHRLARSVVVIDEAQSLPQEFLRPCLAALRELADGYGSSVIFSTATPPAIFQEDGFLSHRESEKDVSYEAMQKENVVELADDPAALYAATRRMNPVYIETQSDEDLEFHIGRREQVLIILDSITHVRSLFDRCSHMDGVYHLSTRMTPKHRRAVLAEIKVRLRDRLPVRLIATSLIQAGVDVDFPVVMRSMAGLDSLVQAAGRGNRNGLLDGLGEFLVFDPEDREGSKPPHQIRLDGDISRRIVLDPRFRDDFLSIEAVREFFRRKFWRAGAASLDAAQVGPVRGIMSAIQQDTLDSYPFADIAQAFQLIDSGQSPIIIWNGPWGPSDDTKAELALQDRAFLIARTFQQYQVQVPIKTRDELVVAGHLLPWRPEEFGDQFFILVSADLYEDRAGLINPNTIQQRGQV